MATGAQIKAEVELMLDEQDDEPLRMSELQRELESRLGLEPGSMKEHKSVLLKIVEKIHKRRARARKKERRERSTRRSRATSRRRSAAGRPLFPVPMCGW